MQMMISLRSTTDISSYSRERGQIEGGIGDDVAE
jgi:hypothetical protein